MKKTNLNLNRKEKLTKHCFRCDSLHSGMYLWFFKKVLSLFLKMASDGGGLTFGAQLVPNSHSAIRKASLTIRCFITWDLKICFSAP